MDLVNAFVYAKVIAIVFVVLIAFGLMSFIIGLLKVSLKLIKLGIIVTLIMALLSAVGYFGGKSFLKTNYVEKKVAAVEDKLTDDGMKKKVNNYVQQMLDSGAISQQQIDSYITNIQKDPNLILTLPDGTVVGGGAEAVTDATTDAGTTVTISPTATPAPTKAPSKKITSGYGSTADKVMSAMTASDLAITQNTMSKVDIGKLQSLLNTDVAAAKAYVKSVLSSSEIAAAINVYGKYAYLLN